MRLLRAASVVLFLLISFAFVSSERVPAFAQSTGEAEEMAEAAEREAAAADGLLSDTMELRAGIEDELAESIAELSRLNAELSRVSVELDSIRLILATAETELASISETLAARAVAAYMRAVGLPAASAMGTHDAETAIVAATSLEDTIQSGQSEVADLTIKRRELERLRHLYMEDQEQVVSLQAEADAEAAHLESLWAEADVAVAEAAATARSADASYRAALDEVAAARARQAERDRQEDRAATSTTSTVPGTTTTNPPSTPTTTTVPAPVSNGAFPPAVERWRPLVSSYFPAERTDEALAVLRCESGGDPEAYNPYSGASGLFQFLPSTWATTSPRAGFGGSAVFEAEANIGTAAWLSAYYESRGSGPWAPWTCRP
ncbi:hypothetical protein BH23ACT5_BH23ACT5_09380 [soil metagenome]